MPRGTLVVDEKLLREHFMKQQSGGISLGIVVHVFKEIMGVVEFLRALRDMLSVYSNKVLKLLAKEQYKQPQKLVKMYSKEKMLENLKRLTHVTLLKTLPNKEKKPYYNKLGADAREGKANALIYQLQRG